MERHASERRFTPCAEFPNDNPDLHHGSIWDWVNLCDVPISELPGALSGTVEVDGKTRDLVRMPDPAPIAATPRIQVVGLLTILEGVPREAAADVHAIEIEAAEPAAIEPTLGTFSDSMAGPLAEEEAPASSPPIVSMLTNTAELPAETEAEELPPIVSLPTDDGLAVESPGDGGEPIEIVDELSFDDAVDDEMADAETLDPVPDTPPADPFAQLVSALRSVAHALGAGDAAIASLDALLGQTRLDGTALDPRAMEALIAGEVIARGARGIARCQAFTAKVLAWQGILRGECEDFGLPDGGALEPLDEWAADLLARIVGPPARADGIRRDLRRRGIAAFGLVADAA